MLRVARIPYLNSAPFYRTVAAQIDLLDLPPRQLGVAAREGAVDAGILSMCDIFRIPGLTSLIPVGAALLLGQWVRGRIDEVRFRKVLLVSMVVIGLNLIRRGIF